MPFILIFSKTYKGGRKLDLSTNWDSSQEEIQGIWADWWWIRQKTGDELEHTSVGWNMGVQVDWWAEAEDGADTLGTWEGITEGQRKGGWVESGAWDSALSIL